MWKSCCAALAALLLSASVLAQGVAPITLEAGRNDVELSGHLEWLEDASARMTLAEVQAAPGWTVLPGMPNAGFTRSAIWLRLTLDQPADGRAIWILDIDDTQLDEAQLYVPQLDGEWHVRRAGRLVTRTDWPLDSRTPAFRLRLPKGQHEVYLRLQSQHALSHTLRLASLDGYLVRNSHQSLFFGAYFGIFMAVIVLQFFFWLLTRDVLSGWYMLYSLVLLTVTLLRAGYPQHFLGVYQPNVSLLGVFINLAPLAVVRLTAVWLELHRHMPRVNLLFQSSAYVMALLTTGMLLLDNHARALQLGQVLTVLWFTVAFGIAYHLWRRKVAEARDYLQVFSIMVFWIVIRMLRNLGLLPVNFFTDNALYIGVILHLLLLSLFFIFRYKTLQSSLQREQRAREEQRDFVSMVSHEFRTPLAIINTSIQQLAANLDAPAEKSLARAQNIRNAIQRMDLLLDDYLSLDRLDSAQQALRPRVCDFYEVIEDAASDWPLGRVRIILDRLPPRFVCDPDLMRIVLRNLLANAVRHSPASTVVELDVTGQGDGSLRIKVRDHGEGIPAEEQVRLFQRYFRGRASQGKPGAGLGLHLVQRIVQLHGGSVDVQSSLGQGTTFRITLPAGQLPNV
jgi:signal transduction histidine kinase